MLTYLHQLDRAAKAKKTTLEDVAETVGIAKTSVWRWRSQMNDLRQATAEKLWKAIQAA